MIKRLHIFVSLLAIAFTASAQTTPVELGLYTGAGINTAGGSGVSQDFSHSSTGFGAGAHLKIKTGKDFGIKIAMSYDQLGWELRHLVFFNDNTNEPIDGDVTIRLNYVNVVVMPEWAAGKKTKFIFGAGPFLGFLAHSKGIIHYHGVGPNGTDHEEVDNLTDKKKLNYGIAITSGVRIPVGPRINIDLRVRYLRGLADINDDMLGSGTVKLDSWGFFPGVSIALPHSKY